MESSLRPAGPVPLPGMVNVSCARNSVAGTCRSRPDDATADAPQAWWTLPFCRIPFFHSCRV
ncbi:hypothetical protein SXCC_03443 [Gluconacetobacter sp. SXCC-1]|nr:hypothetical protein SXCC_03443 [Gluconacetobacter sp. SXCC-1]